MEVMREEKRCAMKRGSVVEANEGSLSSAGGDASKG